MNTRLHSHKHTPITNRGCLPRNTVTDRERDTERESATERETETEVNRERETESEFSGGGVYFVCKSDVGTQNQSSRLSVKPSQFKQPPRGNKWRETQLHNTTQEGTPFRKGGRNKPMGLVERRGGVCLLKAEVRWLESLCLESWRYSVASSPNRHPCESACRQARAALGG